MDTTYAADQWDDQPDKPLDDVTQPTPAAPGDGAPRPVVWAGLTADEAEFEWLRLNEWVEDVRAVFCIPATVIPPFWHRHKLLVEHLSALHTHWLAAYDPDQHGSAPFGWVRDLDEWKNRMREAVSQLGCRIDACRTEAFTRWPGEPDPDPTEWAPVVNLQDRYDDFVTLVLWDVKRRRDIEARYMALIAEAADRQGGAA